MLYTPYTIRISDVKWLIFCKHGKRARKKVRHVTDVYTGEIPRYKSSAPKGAPLKPKTDNA